MTVVLKALHQTHRLYVRLFVTMVVAKPLLLEVLGILDFHQEWQTSPLEVTYNKGSAWEGASSLTSCDQGTKP